MNENDLKGELAKLLRTELPGYVILCHVDHANSGVPDISVNEVVSTWWELKLADPDFESQGIQEVTMLRLNRCGYARYIIYDSIEKEIRIIEPKYLKAWRTSGISNPWTRHEKHQWVVEQIKKVHNAFRPQI